MTVAITDFILDGRDYFTANLDNGKVRIGFKGLASADLPPHHRFFKAAKGANNEHTAARVFDALIENGIVKF